ncbi:MAG TPA: proline hydroxylase [Alphaproteobacteria bacterium]|nr:proline hydroxylase [Alphaproteobacteria bacterium]
MDELLNYQKYMNEAADINSQYSQAEEFPHIVIDNFLNEGVLDEALKKFPAIDNDGWIHYQHYNENKGGLNKRDYIPDELLKIIDELNSEKFVSLLREITGIKNLFPDTSLEGGGIHQIRKGGFLNIHADFTTHPHNKLWKRRVNVLLYLNKDWKDEYGGQLELWTKDMKKCFKKILPLFNRCVIFNTDLDSFHGHPHPLTCPDDRTRKSIALYYFTEEKTPPVKVATNYQHTPDDSLTKRLFIWLDKKALVVYNHLKGFLGINDDFVSKLMNFIRKLRK